MAWDEWEDLKRQASEEKSPRTQLDHLPSTGGGGDKDLVVHQDDLGAIGHQAYALHDALRRHADIDGMGFDGQGDGTTMQAANELKSHGFATGTALSSSVKAWTSQVNTLLQACATISNHLNYSQKTHAHDDAVVAASMKRADGSATPVSELRKYFK
ncbi:hypothetical protein QWJ26_38250 [Streptomyces sp. CSDS2]|uniref:hypothetical protein n=1 Tax=Streptomyces sp. CSDS2 TaxID=3055051 RepID=UPI0025B2724C|nr:hypothetical protein [Streptomyces sp. CSDS2]MDN3265549.1 hypothetical protein [Streptomyces sp. CSDS2]